MSCSIDHILIAVHDLAHAQEAYAQFLGRAPSWHGTHPTHGSANCLFRLDNIYLELLAANGDGAGGDAVRAHLAAHGEGLLGIAFAHDDLSALAAHMATYDITTNAPQDGYGIDDISGQTRHWQNMFWSPAIARGVLSFAIAHENNNNDFGGLPMASPQCASPLTAIDHIVLRTRNGDAAARFYGDILGLRLALRQNRPQWGGDMLFFRSRQMHIEVIANHKRRAEYDSLWGLAFKTDNIDETHARLCADNIEVSEIRDGHKPHTRVATVKSHVLSIPTLLIEHPASTS